MTTTPCTSVPTPNTCDICGTGYTGWSGLWSWLYWNHRVCGTIFPRTNKSQQCSHVATAIGSLPSTLMPVTLLRGKASHTAQGSFFRLRLSFFTRFFHFFLLSFLLIFISLFMGCSVGSFRSLLKMPKLQQSVRQG